ncbi:MAG: hypothetical protein H7A37_04490 [Chlamydiales bacterium]|nr:hypothetical protein [Chlamydiia bacterium]MCP5507542.1 hypothetical protein [Chlamydiales bacterium]
MNNLISFSEFSDSAEGCTSDLGALSYYSFTDRISCIREGGKAAFIAGFVSMIASYNLGIDWTVPAVVTGISWVGWAAAAESFNRLEFFAKKAISSFICDRLLKRIEDQLDESELVLDELKRYFEFCLIEHFEESKADGKLQLDIFLVQNVIDQSEDDLFIPKHIRCLVSEDGIEFPEEDKSIIMYSEKALESLSQYDDILEMTLRNIH